MYSKQIIFAIDREYASGGREIAEILSKELNLPIYDHNIVELLKQDGSIQTKGFLALDESPRNKLFSRTVRGMTNSNESGLASMQFEFLKRKASEGESFIVLGHCANEILKEYPNMISLFVSAGKKFKYERAVHVENIPADEAVAFIKKKNKERKTYHNSHCDSKWGDSRNYDLCLKSDFLGIKRSARLILDDLELRKEKLREDDE